jgi:Domain of unknown function (DUF4386)
MEPNMAEPDLEASPRVYARIGGALYLIIIVVGLFAEVGVRGKLVVSGDATATARNIVASPLLWRSGVAGELFMLTCAVALTLIFYVLLRPVSKHLALLAAFFNLVSIAIQATYQLNLLQGSFALADAAYLKVFEPSQLHALAYLAIKSHGYGYGIALIFFGCECIVLGYLILRSGFFPRLLGLLMQIAGVCYLVNSFALILAPTLADMLFPAVLIPAFIGEASFCVWLLVKGVDVPKWEARAGVSTASRTVS